MKYTFWTILVFVSGINFCAIVTRLVTVNQNFEASWLKAAVAMILAIYFAFNAWAAVKR